MTNEQTLSTNDEQAFDLWFRTKKARAYLEQKRKARRERIWNAVILAASVIGGAVVVAILAASAFIATAILNVLING